MNIKETVYNYKTKHESGFTSQEIKDLININYPDISMDKFNDALFCVTARVIDDEIVIYKHDVELGIICGVENRNLYTSEFD